MSEELQNVIMLTIGLIIYFGIIFLMWQFIEPRAIAWKTKRDRREKDTK